MSEPEKYTWVSASQLRMVDRSLTHILDVLKALSLISDGALAHGLSCETLLLRLDDDEE